MANNDDFGSGLLVLACATGAALIGAIGGAAAMTTERGKKTDAQLNHCYNKAKGKMKELSGSNTGIRLLK